MSFLNFKSLMGGAVVLAACLSAGSGMARPLSSQTDSLLAQENRPPTEGVPPLNRDQPYRPDRGPGGPGGSGGSSGSGGSGGSGGRGEMTQEVRGRVTRVNGDAVEIRTSGGTVRTYTISEADQERNKIQVGSDVVLTVRGNDVVAISPAGASSSSSSSSSSTMQRQTTTQQTRPAPAPAAPQPVRGLW